MTDPYEILGVQPEDGDDVIRQRYLELVRQFSPEQHPQRFAAIRAAYDSVKDLDTRIRTRLFETGSRDTIEQIIEELTCRMPRRRFSLPELMKLTRLAQ
jgi:DnaJ-class molecular chaperone